MNHNLIQSLPLNYLLASWYYRNTETKVEILDNTVYIQARLPGSPRKKFDFVEKALSSSISDYLFNH